MGLADTLRAQVKVAPKAAPASPLAPAPPEVESEYTPPEEAIAVATEGVGTGTTDISAELPEPKELVPLELHHIGVERAPVFLPEGLNRYVHYELTQAGFTDMSTFDKDIKAMKPDWLLRGLKKRLILDIGGKMVLLEENEQGDIGYHHAFKTNAEVALQKFRRDTYDRLPTEMKDEEVDLRGSSAGKVLARFTQVVSGTFYDLTRTRSFYNVRTKQFVKAPCPPRALLPRFDANIARFLELLGGQHHEKLLDWLATFTDLSRPTCALYFHGQSRGGKSLLALALNRYWNKDGKPTPLWRYFDNFNNDIVRSGLLVADETMGADKVKFETTDLRDLIMSRMHDVFTKNQDPARALGCFRIILASNPSNMLDLDVRGLDPHSLAAVGIRFLPIEVTSQSADFIRSIGGQDGGTKNWVEGDEIIRHALWLRDNRAVTPGVNGLLVDGSLSASRDLLVATGPADTILGLLTDVLSGHALPSGLDVDTVFYGSGNIYIVMDKLRIYLDRHMKKPYQRKTLSNALVNLQRMNAPENFRPRVYSYNSNIVVQPRVFDIDPQHLSNYMTQTRSGDPKKVEEALRRVQIKGNSPFAPMGAPPKAEVEN